MTEPPGPPLPPSGPPSGLNFSRWTEATPCPPRPALMCSDTRSTKVGTAMAFLLSVVEEVAASWRATASKTKEGRPRDQGRPSTVKRRWVSVRSLARDDVDDAATATRAELDGTADEREQGVVTAATDAGARV